MADERLKGMGNWLGKTRHNITMTDRGWDLTHRLAMEYGLDHSAIIELAVREKYLKEIGPLPPIKYVDGRPAR